MQENVAQWANTFGQNQEVFFLFFVFVFLLYVGLSLLWPLLLGSTGSGRAGSAAMAHGPSCSAACGIFPDRGMNPCPLHRQADSQPLHHQGSPRKCFISHMPIFSYSEFNYMSPNLTTRRIWKVRLLYTQGEWFGYILLSFIEHSCYQIILFYFHTEHSHPFLRDKI